MTATVPKVALITGGAGGIGAAVARRLAGQGWRIVIGRHRPCRRNRSRDRGGRTLRPHRRRIAPGQHRCSERRRRSIRTPGPGDAQRSSDSSAPADYIRALGVAILDTERAADAILADEHSGQAWLLVPNAEPSPMQFASSPNIMADPTQTVPETPR